MISLKCGLELIKSFFKSPLIYYVDLGTPMHFPPTTFYNYHESYMFSIVNNFPFPWLSIFSEKFLLAKGIDFFFLNFYYIVVGFVIH